MRKFLLNLSVIGFSATFLFASTFAASEFLKHAETLSASGVINTQSSEAGYQLNSNLSRAEAAKLVVNTMQISVRGCSGTVYTDVSAKLGNLCGFIETARANRLVANTPNYRPDDPITRAEFAKFVVNAVKLPMASISVGYSDVSPNNTLAGYINTLANAGIVNKSLHFHPNNTITRGEAFKMLVGALKIHTTNRNNSIGGTVVSGES